MREPDSLPNMYLEDFVPGQKFRTGSFTITEEALIDFAQMYDPQPMHIDHAAAAAGPFGGLIASGWHTAAVVMKLTAEAKPWGDTPILGLGVSEMFWPQPVRAGDTIEVEIEVLSMRPSGSRPTHGVVKFRSVAFNQKGEVVFQLEPSCWVPKRPNS